MRASRVFHPSGCPLTSTLAGCVLTLAGCALGSDGNGSDPGQDGSTELDVGIRVNSSDARSLTRDAGRGPDGGDPDGGIAPPDGDTVDAPGLECTDRDGDGHGVGCSMGRDCDDDNPAIHASARELCEGLVDENCDGVVDEGCAEDDPFLPGSCSGSAWTLGDATARLGSASREVLASATIEVRTRSCDASGSCGAWSDGRPWMTHFLTYSGGVTTRYQDIRADTRLVLFDNRDEAQLSIQHVTFGAGGYDDDEGMVFAFPPSMIRYPRFRAYNVSPVRESDYRDLEVQITDGELILGDGCARFVAQAYGASEPITTEYAALYRW